MENTKVTFRRINGRIVPIRGAGQRKEKKAKGGMTKSGLAGSAAAGAFIGDSVGERTGQRAAGKIGAHAERMLFKDTDSAREMLKRSGIKDVEAVASHAEAAAHTGLSKRYQSKGFWDSYSSAGFLPAKKKVFEPGKLRESTTYGGYLLTQGDTMNRSVISHELGHAIDYQKNPGRVLRQGRDVIFGGQYAMEKRAWDLAPFPVDQKVRDSALGTYKALRDHKRIGIAVGAGVALGGYALWKWMQKKKGQSRGK